MWLIGIDFFKCGWWPAYLFELRVLSRNAVSLKLVMPRRLLSWKHVTGCKYGTSLIPDQSGKNYCISRILEIRLSHVKRSMLWFCLGSKGWRRLGFITAKAILYPILWKKKSIIHLKINLRSTTYGHTRWDPEKEGF